jgi:radical SAM superfamily enzyme YgiQ (UPF0313 family)
VRLKLIYPQWRKLDRQTTFHLPPHGPVVFAATVPDHVTIDFVDENVDTLDMSDHPDLVGLSVMLSAQVPRAKAIADEYRAKGVPVIAGGISAMLHAEEFQEHCDSVFLGEAEGRFADVIPDLERGGLKPVYDYLQDHPDIRAVGPARRDILNRERYRYRGVQMLDLVHASRGCRFNCFPCCTAYLGGRQFRPRPIDTVIEEIEAIPNNRLFIVDNSLAQDDDWEEQLFKELIPLKKKWVSHPIKSNDPERHHRLLDLAYEAGCWYVYQAVVDISDNIRNRIQAYKDHGIGVEGTIMLGTDDQDEEYIKRLVEFLLELELDTAEFTIMTPILHTPVREQLEREGRILHNRWEDYGTDRVVFQPKRMTPDTLQEMFYWAWDQFYAEEPQEVKMGKLFMQLMEREIQDGTYVRPLREQPAGSRQF